MSTLHVSKFWESKQAPVLVLLHGWGSSSKIWQPCISQLCKDFQVWCVDLPGHGQSHSISWDRSVEQGLGLLESVLPRNSIIVGWSLGGLFAQLFLQHYPQRVENLMLIASTPKFTASKNWPHGMAKETLNSFVQKFSSSPQQTLKQFYLLQTLHSIKAKKILQLLEHSTNGQFLKSIEWGLQWLEVIDLRRSQIPGNIHIQILQGVNDQVSSVEAAEDTKQLWGNVSLNKISNAGHVPFLSHPQIFFKKVQSTLLLN